MLLEFAKSFDKKRPPDWQLETYQSTLVDKLRLLKSFLLFQLFFFLRIKIDNFDTLLIDQSTFFNLKFFIGLKLLFRVSATCYGSLGISGDDPILIGKSWKTHPKFSVISVFRVISWTDSWKIHPGHLLNIDEFSRNWSSLSLPGNWDFEKMDEFSIN